MVNIHKNSDRLHHSTLEAQSSSTDSLQDVYRNNYFLFKSDKTFGNFYCIRSPTQLNISDNFQF